MMLLINVYIQNEDKCPRAANLVIYKLFMISTLLMWGKFYDFSDLKNYNRLFIARSYNCYSFNTDNHKHVRSALGDASSILQAVRLPFWREMEGDISSSNVCDIVH